jgi:nucleoside-diphosphate-sugar epimerase
MLLPPSPKQVDVRDVARAHILAAETPKAAGQRFIVSSAVAVKKEAVARAAFDALPNVEIMDMGTVKPHTYVMFCSRTLEAILGMTLRPPVESLRDMAQAMVRIGSAKVQYRGSEF